MRNHPLDDRPSGIHCRTYSRLQANFYGAHLCFDLCDRALSPPVGLGVVCKRIFHQCLVRAPPGDSFLHVDKSWLAICLDDQLPVTEFVDGLCHALHDGRVVQAFASDEVSLHALCPSVSSYQEPLLVRLFGLLRQRRWHHVLNLGVL